MIKKFNNILSKLEKDSYGNYTKLSFDKLKKKDKDLFTLVSSRYKGETKLKLFSYLENKYKNYYKPVFIYRAFISEVDCKKVKTKDKESLLLNKKYSLKDISKCLYTINKEAKRYRDMCDRHIDDCYYDGIKRFNSHYLLHEAKSSKEYYYNIKNKVMNKLISLNLIQINNVHYFEATDNIADYYVVEGFNFHHNFRSSKDFDINKLQSIDNQISSNKTIRSYPVSKALFILNKFLDNVILLDN